MAMTKSESMVLMVNYQTEEDLGLREIQAQVNQTFGKEWKPQTVSTFLARLVKKQYLDMYRKGRVFYYKPHRSLESIRKEQVSEMTEIFFQNNPEDLKSFILQAK